MAGNRKIQNGVRFPVKKEKSFIILFALGICLIVFMISFFPMTRSIEDDAYIKHLERRLADLENRLEGVDLNPEMMRKLKIQSTRMESYVNNYGRMDASINLKSNMLAGRLDKLQSQIDRMGRNARGTTVNAKKRTSNVRKNTKKIASLQRPKTIRKKKKYQKNKRLELHIVKKGETFYSISRKYGISLKNLKKLNGFTEKTIIYPGQKIIVN